MLCMASNGSDGWILHLEFTTRSSSITKCMALVYNIPLCMSVHGHYLEINHAPGLLVVLSWCEEYEHLIISISLPLSRLWSMLSYLCISQFLLLACLHDLQKIWTTSWMSKKPLLAPIRTLFTSSRYIWVSRVGIFAMAYVLQPKIDITRGKKALRQNQYTLCGGTQLLKGLCHASLLLFKITLVDPPCPWFRSYIDFNIQGPNVLHGVRANAEMHRASSKPSD
ncbi:hypothetical protein VNO77_18924 [Canavalia gladiata]|uniref:Uncharacterized protein n=1 Tax=Canavalia gladiata TaxID=3824 RepID=A0AAN9LRM6_CANGL